MNKNDPTPMHQFQNFVAHEKTVMPFKKSPQYPKYHKIILRSADKIAGTNQNATFQINLPDYEFMRSAVLFVESFVMANGDSGALNGKIYSCHLPQLLQPKSYSSATGNLTDVLFSTTGYTFQDANQQTSVGIPILNPTLFNNKQINITFDSPVGGFSTTNDYILTLAIYEVADSEI